MGSDVPGDVQRRADVPSMRNLRTRFAQMDPTI